MKAVSLILDSLSNNQDFLRVSNFTSLYSLVKYYNSISITPTLILCAKNSKAALKQVIKCLDDYTGKIIDLESENPYDKHIAFLFMVACEADPSISDILAKKISKAKNLYWADKIVTSGLLKQELAK